MDGFDELNQVIVDCRLCPRLVEYRERIAREKRKAFAQEEYWGRPVPNFGDPNAERLIVGLAPAAHGGNRTGRVFTGDRSGDWLFAALYRAGVANQPESIRQSDGMELKWVLITALAHCAPPDNKPTREELLTCGRYLLTTVEMRPWKAILCLGSMAWNATLALLGERPPKFGHGVECSTKNGILLVASYHPSQQNTFTGKLTEPMLDAAINRWLGR